MSSVVACLDSDILTTVQRCEVIVEILLRYREGLPDWLNLHIDHASLFHGKLFVILVNAYSKWINMHIATSTSFESSINKLQTIFTTLFLP